MPHSREKSPGSFRDELGRVIDRDAPNDKTGETKPGKATKQGIKDTADLNDRLFEQAWKRPGA